MICRATLFCVLSVEADDTAILEIVENAVAQNLRDYVDAVQLVAPNLRAAATACAGGVAAFMGVGSPLTTVKGAGPEITDHELDAAAAFFRRCGVDSAVFELASWTSRATAGRLSRRGYEIVGSKTSSFVGPRLTPQLPPTCRARGGHRLARTHAPDE